MRGAFANYYKQLSSDFKSIAASGWGAELIPDQDILQSQFPQVLAELQALFAAAGEEDFEDVDGTGVLPPEQVKDLKAQLKEARGLAKKDTSFGDWQARHADGLRLEAQLARHKALEDEAKVLEAMIKSTEKNRDELVAAARQRISPDETPGDAVAEPASCAADRRRAGTHRCAHLGGQRAPDRIGAFGRGLLDEEVPESAGPGCTPCWRSANAWRWK